MARKKRRQPSVDAATFAERLNRLFTAVYPPGRGPYRNCEVTEALARRGHRMSAPYLSQLRSGVRQGPSPRTAEMLAEFFGVKVDYFDTHAAYADALDVELDWHRLLRDESVRDLTSALMQLTPGVRDGLLEQAERCQIDCIATIAEQSAQTLVAPEGNRAGCSMC